jgi:uncharacterized protein involved in tolerance to divalent cations
MMGSSMRYRRADVAGTTYFFTFNLAEQKRNLLMEHVDVLRAVIQEVKAVHPFHIDAMVILPVTYMPYEHYPWMIAITRHSGH